MRQTIRSLALLTACLGLAAAGPARAAGPDATQIRKAMTFLADKKRGQAIVGYLHFGSTYRGHELVKDGLYTVADSSGRERPGYFALEYVFYWETDEVNRTWVQFFFDNKGHFYSTKVTKTQAILNQPWALANASIQLVGNLLYKAFENQMSDSDKRTVRKILEDADAKRLCEWRLAFEQLLGR